MRSQVAATDDGASTSASRAVAGPPTRSTDCAAVPPHRVGRPRIWISHGTDDRVLPVARCGRRLAHELDAGGYDVTYEEFDGGHVVPPDLVTAALTTWLGPAD